MPRNGSFGGDELDLMAEARRRRKDSCKETETKEDITTTLIFSRSEPENERRIKRFGHEKDQVQCL